MTTSILGIDFSLSSPAYTLLVDKYIQCYVYSKIKSLYNYTESNFCLTIYPIQQKFQSSYDRMNYFATATAEIAKLADVVYIENYSFSSIGKVFSIAEITGFVKYQCWLAGKPPVLITPATIKKYATGKGNATKEQMIDSFIQKTTIDLYEILGINKTRKNKSPISDIADSYHLASLGKYLQESRHD